MTSLKTEKSGMDKRSPLVTIGMPVRNGAQDIGAALNSLLAQTFNDFELIISDNASTDETEAICYEYQVRDLRVRYVRQAEDIGMIENFQFVVDQANGDFFMWAAHDDEWDSRFVEAGVNALQGDEKAVVAFGSVRYVQRGAGVFMVDRPPYSLDGPPLARMRQYLCTNVTDNMMYGLFRTPFLRSNPLTSTSTCPEKILIARAVASGGIADAFDMCYTNNYSFKTIDDLKRLGLIVSRWKYRKVELVIFWIVAKSLPFLDFWRLLPKMARYRLPLIRKILGTRLKDHAGRIRHMPPVRIEDALTNRGREK